MKLKVIKIKNYRSYAGEHVIEFDSRFTSFIGKNDAGKSTIFDALDIFVGNKKPDLGDLCVVGDDRLIEITAVFSQIPTDVEIDAGAVTSLQEEYLLNGDGCLEIKKIFKCTDKTVSSPEVYIIANYPKQEQVEVLHKLNNADLKKLGESMSVTVDDKKVNHLWRKAIWSSVKDLELVQTELKIEDFETKAKKIYSKLEEHMPLVFVFRADREMTDSESEAKDPMQLAVAEAQLEFQKEIEDIQTKIQERVDAVAEVALEKLREMHPTLADKLKPVHKSKPKWTFDYKIEDDKGVALNKRGSGTRRLVLLNFFRAQAEQKGKDANKGIIYAIEEPETSQHPDNQMLVMDALTELAGDDSRQVMITTHSPELLKKVADEFSAGTRFIQTDEDDSRDVVNGPAALPLAAKALKILSAQMFGAAEKVVLLEGKDDCFFLTHAAEVMKEAGEITHTLEEAHIALLPVGGCSGVREWVESERYKELGLSTYVFLDSDREAAGGATTPTEAFVASIVDPLIVGKFTTQKREIENYINQDYVGIQYGDYDDAKTAIRTSSGLPKNQIMGHYWGMATIDDIDEEIKEIIRQMVSVN